jgi:hypothetical protein
MKLFQMLMAGTMLVSSMVFAGESAIGGYGVVIDSEEQTAGGLMGTARFSDVPEEFIGCGVRHTLVDGALDSWGWCIATKDSETSVRCKALDPELIDKMADLNHYSYVVFGWDDNGECTHFGFSTQSGQIPGFKDIKD